MPARVLDKLIIVFVALVILCAALAWAILREKQINDEKAMSYLSSGGDKSRDGDQDDAIADYNKALELEPNATSFDAELYNSLGSAKSDKGDLEGAMTDYDKALELHPDYSEAYNGRGFVKTVKGDLDGAIADYTRSIEVNPYLTDAYNARGSVELIKGDYQGAMADFRKIIQMDKDMMATNAATGESPDSYFAKIHLYLILRHLHQDTAVAELEKSVKQNPDEFFESMVGSFVLGDLSEADLLAKAAQGDTGATSKRFTGQAFYYIGPVVSGRTGGGFMQVI